MFILTNYMIFTCTIWFSDEYASNNSLNISYDKNAVFKYR